ncbi:MAG: DUF1572 family protein [bacterium]
MAHASYHVGQIVLRARIHVCRNWKSLSIPRGKSQEYNFNPTKELGVAPDAMGRDLTALVSFVKASR